MVSQRRFFLTLGYLYIEYKRLYKTKLIKKPMGDYLKLFETHSEYETYSGGGEMLKPNVSYCRQENEVHYNPYEPNKIITYKAPAKLTETTSDKATGSLNTTKFNTSVVSHTFKDGVGTIEFADDVTVIGKGAFSSCESLTSITIPNSVTSIGDSAFGSCTGLTSINIPDGVTSIGDSAFSFCTGLTSINIPDGVTSIGRLAFGSCTGLTSINIPNSVTSIGDSAFDFCTGLTNINIPDGVTSINLKTFCNCIRLTSVTIPNSVEFINGEAFYHCARLTSINIPDGVTSIGRLAFGYCTGLTSVTVEATTPPALGSTVFADISNFNIYVPAASVEAYKAASGWSDYAANIEAIPTA